MSDLVISHQKESDELRLEGPGVASMFHTTARLGAVTPNKDGDAESFVANGFSYVLKNNTLTITKNA